MARLGSCRHVSGTVPSDKDKTRQGSADGDYAGRAGPSLEVLPIYLHILVRSLSSRRYRLGVVEGNRGKWGGEREAREAGM